MSAIVYNIAISPSFAIARLTLPSLTTKQCYLLSWYLSILKSKNPFFIGFKKYLKEKTLYIDCPSFAEIVMTYPLFTVIVTPGWFCIAPN